MYYKKYLLDYFSTIVYYNKLEIQIINDFEVKNFLKG